MTGKGFVNIDNSGNNNLTNSLFGDVARRQKLKPAKKIGAKLWKNGDTVICRSKEEGIFEAVFEGFKPNSGIVRHTKENRLICVSYRNMLDPKTEKPLKPTKKQVAISAENTLLTAYMPTDEDFKKWLIKKSEVNYSKVNFGPNQNKD